MRWGALVVGVTAVIILGLWVADIASDRSNKLEVLEPITLLKNAPQNYPESNSETGTILPGETLKVLRIGYGKDFRAWLVKGSKGQEGWFIESSKNVRVVGPST